MPRRKRGWRKLSAWTVVVLGLAAGVTMNLITAWLQKDVISNTLYFFLVIFLLAAIIYSGRKMRTSEFLNNIFILIVATVSINLISTWIQYSVLKDTYTLPSITLFLSFSVIALAISGLIQSNYYERFKRHIRMTRISNARSMRPPEFRGIDGMTRLLPKPRRRRKNKH